MFSVSNSCFIAASHTPASPGSAGTYISHGMLYLGSFHFSFKLGKEEIRLPLGPERRKQSLCQGHRGVKDSWLPPSLQPPLDLFCAEREREGNREFINQRLHEKPPEPQHPRERKTLPAEIKSPGEAGSLSLPHAQAPRGLCWGHTSRWSRRRARCPRSLQRASAIAAQGKSGVNVGKTPEANPSPPK